jgi:hypothetical protein
MVQKNSHHWYTFKSIDYEDRLYITCFKNLSYLLYKFDKYGFCIYILINVNINEPELIQK